MAAPCAVRPLAEHSTRWEDIARARWFDLDLPLHFFSPATEAWGIRHTRRISRDAVMFGPSDRSFYVGDELRYLLLFPGTEGKPGAVGVCRGRIVRAGEVVVVTIDRCRLRTTASVRAGRDARMRRLVGLCQHAPAAAVMVADELLEQQTGGGTPPATSAAPRSTLRRISVSVLAVAAKVAVRLALDPVLGNGSPFLLFTPADNQARPACAGGAKRRTV